MLVDEVTAPLNLVTRYFKHTPRNKKLKGLVNQLEIENLQNI